MVTTWYDDAADARDLAETLVPPPVSSTIELAARSVDSAPLTEALLRTVRIPYGLRRVPLASFSRLVPLSEAPRVGDIVLASLQKVGKNTRLELSNGRPSAFQIGDLLAVVFGNRYATMQFEGYARARNGGCDLLSMGGLCGIVESKHDSVAESTKLRILGAVADANGNRLRLADYRLPRPLHRRPRPNIAVVCGTSMDAGKTYTATSLIRGLRRHGAEVAGIKLTGTAAGRDTWGMLDAGARVALDFVDGGLPSTYRSSLQELLALEELLVEHAASEGAEWVVMEIADGLLQSETSALLTCPEFTKRITAWVFAAGDAMSAESGVRRLREWNLEPCAISGRVTMSPLAMREAEAATQVRCVTAREIQAGELTGALMTAARTAERRAVREPAA